MKKFIAAMLCFSLFLLSGCTQKTADTNLYGNSMSNMSCYGFAVSDGGTTYVNDAFGKGTKRLLKIDDNGNIETLAENEDGFWYLSVFNGSLYYLNKNFELFCRNLETGDTQKVLDGVVYYMIRNAELYYVSSADQYLYKMDAGTPVCVIDQQIYNFYFYHDYIFYNLRTEDGKGKFLRAELNGENAVALLPEHFAAQVNFLNDKIFFVYNNVLYAMDMDGANQQRISKENEMVWYLNNLNGALLCNSNMLGSPTLVKKSPDGKKSQEIYDKPMFYINVAGGQIYFVTTVHEGEDLVNKLCFVRGDGTGLATIS